MIASHSCTIGRNNPLPLPLTASTGHYTPQDARRRSSLIALLTDIAAANSYVAEMEVVLYSNRTQVEPCARGELYLRTRRTIINDRSPGTTSTSLYPGNSVAVARLWLPSLIAINSEFECCPR
jgi:hypothetical protein